MSKLTDISLQKLTSLKKMPPAQPAPEPKYRADEGAQGLDGLSLASPHLFEEKRRSGCGCGCTWLLILALVAGAGGAASWYFLDAQDKVQIRNGIGSLLGGTPLEFLRSFILPYMEAKPPVPPINESGDHGVITIPIKEKAPELDPIQPKSEDQPGGQTDGVQEEQPAEQQAQPEKTPLREDARVRMPFISDLASSPSRSRKRPQSSIRYSPSRKTRPAGRQTERRKNCLLSSRHSRKKRRCARTPACACPLSATWRPMWSASTSPGKATPRTASCP